MNYYFYVKHPRNTYIMNGKIYHSLSSICKEMGCSVEKMKYYIKKGKHKVDNGNRNTYIFTFPLNMSYKYNKQAKRNVIDSYKVGDIIGNKQIVEIIGCKVKGFKMKCLLCGKINKYNEKALDIIKDSKYCKYCNKAGRTINVTYKGKNFKSLTELAKYLELDLSTVSRHLKRNGNVDTIGKLKFKISKYPVGSIIGNKQIIAEEDKYITIKCLNCGEITRVCKSHLPIYCKRNTCKKCNISKNLKYTNLEYKGVIYKTVKDLANKTGLKIVTIGSHLRKYGNLNKLTGKCVHRYCERYKPGTIIDNIEIVKLMKDKVKARCMKCNNTITISKTTLYSHKADKVNHKYRCKHCNFKNKVVNENAEKGIKVKYKGKTYNSMHALARKLGVSPGKIIGQYHRHNGDLSGLKIKRKENNE